MNQVIIRLLFESTWERSEFLDKHFPHRQCMAAPGCYRIPGWGCVTTHLERVWLYPYKRTMAKLAKKETVR